MKCLSPTVAVVCLLSLRAQGDLVTPSNVRATSQFGLGVITVDNLTDGSGLEGNGAIEDQLHDNVDSNMWFSGCEDAGIDGGTPPDCPTGFEVAPVDEQIVEFELDTTYELTSALIWQYNETNPGVGPLPGRGVKRVELLVSPDLTDSPFSSIGTFDLEIANPDPTPGVFSEGAQTVLIEGLPVARRVRFHVLEGQSGIPTDYVGLSEVRFEGIPAEGPLPPRVIRVLSSDTFSDAATPIEVTLQIVVDPETGPFEVHLEETLPPGWTASNVSDGGVVIAEGVEWLLIVSESTEVIYTLVPGGGTDDVKLDGTYAVDGGEERPILGANMLMWVESAPQIISQPVGGRAPVGSSFTFTVEATGSAPLSYQWEKDEVAIDGSTASSLVLERVEFADAGEYSVVVSNDVDSVISDFAVLEVTPPNLALCGDASQSTTGFGGDARKAIDGDISGESAAVSHTDLGDPMPWWEVRLAADAAIETIVLWNRRELPERLSNFTVLVLDGERGEVWSEQFFPEGSFPAFPETIDEGFEIDVGVTGRIVRIEKGEDVTPFQAGLFLSLAEVEVFGEEPCVVVPPPPCPVEGIDLDDTHCTGLSVEGPADRGSGDYLVTAQGVDDSGDVVHYTFTAVHRRHGKTLIRGPQEVDWTLLPLSFGEWDVSVAVDDQAACDDQAADATRMQVVDVIDPTCVPGELCNVAIRGVARQSSTFIHEAHAAIDGNTDGDINRNSVTHTGFDDPSPTWEVELDQNYDIDSIVLWNRTDCCGERLTNFTVAILDEDGQEVFNEAFFSDGSEWPDTSLDGFEIPVGGETGRTVRIVLLDSHPSFNPGQFFLSLAEVQVFAPAPDPPRGVGPFLRGDADGVGGLNLTDGIVIFNFLFLGGPAPGCLASTNTNGEGPPNITSGVYLLNFLFLGGPQPPEPYPLCGPSDEPVDELLGCEVPSC